MMERDGIQLFLKNKEKLTFYYYKEGEICRTKKGNKLYFKKLLKKYRRRSALGLVIAYFISKYCKTITFVPAMIVLFCTTMPIFFLLMVSISYLFSKFLIKNAKCYIQIQFIQRLPKEYISTGTRYSGNMHVFYPVMGQDTVSGYIGQFYVGEEEHKNSKIGDVIQIDIFDEYMER